MAKLETGDGEVASEVMRRASDEALGVLLRAKATELAAACIAERAGQSGAG